MTFEEAIEHAYVRGQRALLLRQLGEILRELGHDSPEAKANQWVIERAAAVTALRLVCAEFGDNDWPDDAHLGDVIEKHLGRNLAEAKP